MEVSLVKIPIALIFSFIGLLGTENINKTFAGLCEWLIHKGVMKTIYLSRLQVGHSHEVEFNFYSLSDYVLEMLKPEVC